MLLAVELGGDHFLTDVGFGCTGPLFPIRLHESEPVHHHAWTFRVYQEDGVHVLQALQEKSWFDLYAFTLEPQLPVDFLVPNHYTSTHADSPFVSTLIAQRASPNTRWTLRNRELVVETPGERTAETLWDDDALIVTLAELFDLHFPPGKRFHYRI
jgi:N-hydroxyarylamine O-acetyltransferase